VPYHIVGVSAAPSDTLGRVSGGDTSEPFEKRPLRRSIVQLVGVRMEEHQWCAIGFFALLVDGMEFSLFSLLANSHEE
jgi:hypothetical protein